MNASIDKYLKEAERIKDDELARWIQRSIEAGKVCIMLKGEIIDKKLLPDLTNYLAKKRNDVAMSELKLKSEHMNKINSVYQREVSNYAQIIINSAELLQENFLVLRSCGELDNSMIERLANLEKLMLGVRGVKFVEETDLPAPEVKLGRLSTLPGYEQDGTPTSAQRKRSNKQEEDDMLANEQKKSKVSTALEDFQFARPSAMKSINFGPSSTTPMQAVLNLNQTFDIDGIACNETVILANRDSFANLPSTSSKGASKGKR